MTEIGAEQLNEWLQGGREVTLVDTLGPSAYGKEHLPGAINIISDDIVARAPLELADRDAVIVVYCASVNCKRAGLSAERLDRLGYRNVHEFTGGKRAWREAGLPFRGTEHANDG